jgi:mRNA interferase MazF
MIWKGELYWIEGEGYAHPHVVVQDDVFNASRIESVVVCALTSRLEVAEEPGNVLLDVGEGGLEKRSVVVVSQIDAVAKTRLGARIGRLEEARVEQVIAGLRFLQRSWMR